jgi:hypothetical protein
MGRLRRSPSGSPALLDDSPIAPYEWERLATALPGASVEIGTTDTTIADVTFADEIALPVGPRQVEIQASLSMRFTTTPPDNVILTAQIKRAGGAGNITIGVFVYQDISATILPAESVQAATFIRALDFASTGEAMTGMVLAARIVGGSATATHAIAASLSARARRTR